MILLKAFVLCLAVGALVLGFWIDGHTSGLEQELFEAELDRYSEEDGEFEAFKETQ